MNYGHDEEVWFQFEQVAAAAGRRAVAGRSWPELRVEGLGSLRGERSASQWSLKGTLKRNPADPLREPFKAAPKIPERNPEKTSIASPRKGGGWGGDKGGGGGASFLQLFWLLLPLLLLLEVLLLFLIYYY